MAETPGTPMPAENNHGFLQAPSTPPGSAAAPTRENNTNQLTQHVDVPFDKKISITSERLAYLKRVVDEAIRDHRIFTIRGGWATLRRTLLKRNWIEKYDAPKLTKTLVGSGSSEDLCSNLPARQQWETPTAHNAKCERMIMSRLLQVHDVDFYWNTRKDQHDTHLRMNCHKLINRFSRSLFTSKEGLCLLLQQMYWHNEPGVANVNFPRCYVLANYYIPSLQGFPDHFNNFVDDFRLTACASLVKYSIHIMDTEDQYALQSPEGHVPLSALQFAIDRLNEFLATKKHLDIDINIPQVEAGLWEAFLEHFKQIVHEDHFFLENKQLYNLSGMIASGKNALKNVAPYWPQIALDGMKNIWIMKPGNKCRGRGIQLIKDVKDVAKIMEMKLKYVVQKYIERPLIIYNTKFDIRQWFLITSTQPLIVWMYRESYLRFSSQNFSLDDFHESLHLTNHAVQCKYKNHRERNKALPDENMWDCHTFKKYLKQIGQENKWDMVIFPGMKESIIGSMLACQETMDRRPNTYELYGADFILAEDFKPWLLEINSSPDLSSSTSVTARMCPQVLEDLIKVVIDRRRDPNCDTGLFDQIYKQIVVRSPAYLGMSLSVRGRRVFKRQKTKKDKENDFKKLPQPRNSVKLAAPDRPPLDYDAAESLARKYSGPVIADLMEELQKTASDEGGVEIVPPVPLPKRKLEPRVAKMPKAPTAKLTKRNRSSPNRKPSASESSKMPRTAPPPPVPRSTRSSTEWPLNGRASLNSSCVRPGCDVVWDSKDTVSILKGKTHVSKLNKEFTQRCYISTAVSSRRVLERRPISFGIGRDRGLLTVGYGLPMPHLPRPYT